MAYDAAVALKSLGNMKSSQTPKSRKTAGADEEEFGQALASAAGSASDYRDQAAETAVKPETQNAGGQAEAVSDGAVQTESARPAENADGTEAVLAEKLAGVQAGQFMQSMQTGQAVQEVQAEAAAVQAQGAEMPLGGAQTAQKLAAAVLEEGQKTQEEIVVLEGQPEDFAVTEELEPLVGLQKAAATPEEPKEAEEKLLNAGEQPVQAAKETAAEEKPEGAFEGMTDSGKETPKEQGSDTVEVKAESIADRADVQRTYADAVMGNEPARPQPHVTRTGEMREEYADMLKDLIAKQISSGKQEIEISLTPKSLGNMIVKVAYEAGETIVSIICSNPKAMNAMSQKAGELGQILETSLGSHMEVVVDTDNRQESYLYQDGRGGSGEQDGQEKEGSGQKKRQDGKEQDPEDFLQQLRLGLA